MVQKRESKVKEGGGGVHGGRKEGRKEGNEGCVLVVTREVRRGGV